MYFIKWEIQLVEALHPSQNHLQSFTRCCPFQGIQIFIGSPSFMLSSPWAKRQPLLAKVSASLFESLSI